ncbi:hypothetical protein HDU78_000789, partial [Chytriomyces hyalinus]
MDVDNESETVVKTEAAMTDVEPSATGKTVKTEATMTDVEARRVTRRVKWSEEETQVLLKGVARYGVGNWRQIRMLPGLEGRQGATDLKDRWVNLNKTTKDGTVVGSQVGGKKLWEEAVHGKKLRENVEQGEKMREEAKRGRNEAEVEAEKLRADH